MTLILLIPMGMFCNGSEEIELSLHDNRPFRVFFNQISSN